jgi:aspartyl-tRNA(Asn)/glutamyl-tRNA(Gln) amidotransferase subunit C
MCASKQIGISNCPTRYPDKGESNLTLSNVLKKRGLAMIDRKTVMHIAKLARLGLQEDEIDMLGQQLSVILENIAILQEADVSGVSPTAHASRLHNVMREDVPQPSYPPEVLLANAPAQEENCLKVRAVLEEA